MSYFLALGKSLNHFHASCPTKPGTFWQVNNTKLGKNWKEISNRPRNCWQKCEMRGQAHKLSQNSYDGSYLNRWTPTATAIATSALEGKEFESHYLNHRNFIERFAGTSFVWCVTYLLDVQKLSKNPPNIKPNVTVELPQRRF